MVNFSAIVRVLCEHEVEFTIVGGLAGVMQGAPIHTEDLDVLYSIRGDNPSKILAALKSMDAIFWGDARKIRPDISHMKSRGHKLIETHHGRVDCLATIEKDTTFEDVAEQIDWMELEGMPVRVISLPRLIEVKRKLTRPKDKLALLQLEATLEERTKQG